MDALREKYHMLLPLMLIEQFWKWNGLGRPTP